jgi:hypothetical protein
MKVFGLSENILVSLREIQTLRGVDGTMIPSSITQYALFRWVVLAAEVSSICCSQFLSPNGEVQVISEEVIDDYLKTRSLRLEPIRKECKRLDHKFGERKARIREMQRAAESRKRHEIKMRSPSKSPTKRFGIVTGPGQLINTPTRARVLQRLEQLDINSPKRKRGDVDNMDVDEQFQTPTKRKKTLSGKISPIYSLRRQSLASKPTQPVDNDLSSSRQASPLIGSSNQEIPIDLEPSRKPQEQVSSKQESRKSALLKLPSDFFQDEDEGLECPVPSGLASNRHIPLCGTRRELFLDRKPWQEIDPRMRQNSLRFKSLLQFV